MGAIGIAFDIIMTGVLALPWVLLVIHLFFVKLEKRMLRRLARLSSLAGKMEKLNPGAVIAVLLFAATYFLGSVVSRTSQDFFNDDDLHVSLDDFRHHPNTDESKQVETRRAQREAAELAASGTNPQAAASPNCSTSCVSGTSAQPDALIYRLYRVGMTEDRVLASVYCKHSALLRAGLDEPSLKAEIADFQQHCCMCGQSLKWEVRFTRSQEEEDADLSETAETIFSMQEASILLKGEDATLRFRQLHDQVMVLRGAGFNGAVAFSLCLFAWCAAVQQARCRRWLHWALMVVPGAYLAVTGMALWHHFQDRALADPPYMELSLLLLFLAGCRLVWRMPQPADAAGTAKPVDPAKHGTLKDEEVDSPWTAMQWLGLTCVFFLFTFTATLGWWATEVAYAQEVIYTYNSPGMTAAQK